MWKMKQFLFNCMLVLCKTRMLTSIKAEIFFAFWFINSGIEYDDSWYSWLKYRKRSNFTIMTKKSVKSLNVWNFIENIKKFKKASNMVKSNRLHQALQLTNILPKSKLHKYFKTLYFKASWEKEKKTFICWKF